jgi:peptidylprolyl isomerase
MNRNPFVYFKVAVGNRDAGEIIFELFHDVLPITSENFRALCTGETGIGYWLKSRCYQNTHLHRILKGVGAQGGDFNFDNGRMGESIYGQFFRDESFTYAHSKRGLLSMANANKKHTNSSQFFITFNPCPWLDKKHVVFGQMHSGNEVLDSIESAASLGGKPTKEVLIYKSGELSLKQVKELSTSKERPQKLILPELYDPIPDEVYKRSRPYWDNTL